MERLTIIFLLLFLVPACDREAARVGSLSISKGDIERRAAVSAIQYPGSGQPVAGLTQLIKGYLAVEVLHAQGRQLDDKALEAEAARIDGNTKAPDLLNRIKAVYGSDRRAYLDTYIRLVLAERTVYDLFLRSGDIQRSARTKAKALLQEARDRPGAFDQLAGNAKAAVSRWFVSEKRGAVPYDIYRAQGARKAAVAADEDAGGAWLAALLHKLKPGSVYPELIEDEAGFAVLCAERSEGSGLVVAVATVAKRQYDDWFWEQAKKVRVTVRDRQLKEQFLAQVSWAKNVVLE